MFKKVINLFALMMIMSVATAASFPIFVEAKSQSLDNYPEINFPTKKNILNATVHITMIYTELNQKPLENGHLQESQTDSAFQSEGLGTVVGQGSDQVIVTHNHWEALDGKFLEKVTIRSANNSYLIELTGIAFFQLLVYRDSGTMILNVPKAMTVDSIPLKYNNPIVKINDVVFLMHNDVDTNGEIVFIPAKISTIENNNNVPTLSFESLGGESIDLGDSGGGIWANGQLIGNMWRTTQSEKVNLQTGEITKIVGTNKSTGAALSATIQMIIDLNFEEGEMPEAQGKGMH